jgi:hypothetical protein
MGRVGTLQAQLASLVEEEEGLLRQQLDGEPEFRSGLIRAQHRV